MRLLFAGDIRAPHMWRYARYFQESGHICAVVSAETDTANKADFIIETASGPDWIKYLSGVNSFKKIIRSFKPDLINSHFIPNYGFITMLSGFHPHALFIWGSDLLISAEKSFLHRLRTRKILKSADLLLTDADMLTEKARRFAGANKAVLTVPFGIEEKYLRAGMDRRMREEGELTLISTRQLKPLYRVHDFIAALGHLGDQIDFKAVIAGDGNLRADLEIKANETGLNDTEFIGMQSRGDLMNRLLEADIYISCSESDSTSVSLLEAMACGLFPIVSDIEGNREWIEDSKNGLLFSVGDDKALANKIQQAYKDLDLRKNAVMYNFDLIRERALWENIMAGVEREFESLAPKK